MLAVNPVSGSELHSVCVTDSGDSASVRQWHQEYKTMGIGCARSVSGPVLLRSFLFPEEEITFFGFQVYSSATDK